MASIVQNLVDKSFHNWRLNNMDRTTTLTIIMQHWHQRSSSDHWKLSKYSSGNKTHQDHCKDVRCRHTYSRRSHGDKFISPPRFTDSETEWTNCSFWRAHGDRRLLKSCQRSNWNSSRDSSTIIQHLVNNESPMGLSNSVWINGLHESADTLVSPVSYEEARWSHPLCQNMP